MIVSLSDPDIQKLRRRRLQRELGVLVDVPEGARMPGGDVRGYEQIPEAAAISAGVAASGSDGFWKRVSIGVATGVLVFTVTKILDRKFFK